MSENDVQPQQDSSEVVSPEVKDYLDQTIEAPKEQDTSTDKDAKTPPKTKSDAGQEKTEERKEQEKG